MDCLENFINMILELYLYGFVEDEEDEAIMRLSGTYGETEQQYETFRQYVCQDTVDTSNFICEELILHLNR